MNNCVFCSSGYELFKYEFLFNLSRVMYYVYILVKF